ncbi:hypothetical protein [Methanococcoides sp.]|uniref:hypothetical protein n=1 Tax=Methanococcoides sp. TaxID=1966350 RepID=UPI00272E124D|nr:hypothetical protein [Methanococcoides sp.]
MIFLMLIRSIFELKGDGMGQNCCDVCKVYGECSKLRLNQTVDDLGENKRFAACLYACEMEYRKVVGDA